MTISPPEAPVDLADAAAEPPRRRRRWWLLGGGGALLAALVTLSTLAATYQPLVFGGAWGGSFPGAPAPLGARTVNDFGGQGGQIYIPPQGSRAFAVSESVYNPGPRTVTLDQVSLVQPSELSWGKHAWPLISAGPTPWWHQVSPPSGTGRSIAGFKLQPGKSLTVGITVRQTAPCYIKHGWVTLHSFWVKEHFGPFGHWVELPLGQPLVMHEPEPASTNGAICPATG